MSAAMKSGLVSIIVASYNHAEYLEARMESLLNQTYQDIEILVIDDCSTDNSVDVLRHYEVNPKVKLVTREVNGGWVAVSNQGVEMSSGEFIIFANCDDSCAPEMIERLVMSMGEYPEVGISYCRSLMIDSNGSILGDDFFDRESAFQVRCSGDALVEKKVMSRFLLHSCVIPNLSAALFRKKCYLESGGLTAEFRICSDWDLFFRVVNNFDVAYISSPLNEFRQHQTTIRSSSKERVLYGEIISLLLGKVTSLDLSLMEQTKYRLRVMYLWAVYLLQPSFSGALGFTYLFEIAFNKDPISILFLPFGIILRISDVPKIILNRIYSRPAYLKRCHFA